MRMLMHLCVFDASVIRLFRVANSVLDGCLDTLSSCLSQIHVIMCALETQAPCC